MSAPEAAWERLLEVSEKTAEALARIAVVMQQQAVDARDQALAGREHREMILKLANALERLTEVVQRLEDDQRDGREKAVEEIKSTVAAAIKKRPGDLIQSLIAWSAIVGGAALALFAGIRGAKHEP